MSSDAEGDERRVDDIGWPNPGVVDAGKWLAASIGGAPTYDAATIAKATKETWVNADDTNGIAEMLAIMGSIPRHRDNCPAIPIEWERLHYTPGGGPSTRNMRNTRSKNNNEITAPYRHNNGNYNLKMRPNNSNSNRVETAAPLILTIVRSR